MLSRVNRDHYIDQVDYLHSQVSRLSHAGLAHSSDGAASKNAITISFEEELTLWLYRHWSLKETMETTMLTSTKFKLFTEGGQKRMHEFLASIGSVHTYFRFVLPHISPVKLKMFWYKLLYYVHKTIPLILIKEYTHFSQLNLANYLSHESRSDSLCRTF